MIFDRPLAAVRERLGRPDVDTALVASGLVGGVVFIGLMVGAAGIYDASPIGRSRPGLEFAVPPMRRASPSRSGHTLNSTVVAGMLAYLVCVLTARRWLRVLAVVTASAWALGMGLGRVYLGHHWLTDAMFAWLLGLGWLAPLVTVHRVLLRLREDGRPRRSPISLRRGD